MKYTACEKGYSGGILQVLKMDAACAVCNERCGLSDVYCRKCGHKLEPLPAEVPIEDVMKLLTESMHRKRGGGAVAVGQEGSTAPTAKPVDLGGISPAPPRRCPAGRECQAGCMSLMPDGKCGAFVYATLPPQYDDCVFLGGGR